MVGTITYEYANRITASFFYDLSVDSYSLNLGYLNIDFFPDTAQVGDCLVISLSNISGKYSGLNFNVGTALIGTGVVLVWEYAKRGTGYYNPTWHALTGVVDNTNGFTTIGVNTIRWDMPEDWENFFNPNSTTRWYEWFVRCRIVSMTTLTEGGKQTGILYANVNNIVVDGFTVDAPCTMDDIYNASVTGGWGVISKNERCYSVGCGLTFNANNYFSTQNETIQFLKNNDIHSSSSAVTLSGLQYMGDKVYAGSIYIFNVYNSSLPKTLIIGGNSNLFNTQIKHVHMTGSSIFHGHWGGGIGQLNGQKIYDVFFDNFRNTWFTAPQNAVIGCKIAFAHTESGGAIIAGCTFFGALAVRGMSAVYPDNFNNYFHNNNYSKCSNYMSNPYAITVNGWVENHIDCIYNKNILKERRAYWTVPNATDIHVKLWFSLLLKVIDEKNNGIEGATVTVKNKNDTIVFQQDTTEDGYPTEEYGTVTNGYLDKVKDLSKNWSTSQWHNKEVFITANQGIGQRRNIYKGNNATEIYVAPHFEVAVTHVAPASRYIIIPYIQFADLTPITLVSNGYSTYVDYNPFTLEIKKSGYKTYKTTMNIEDRVDWTITLQKVKDASMSKRVNINR
ncbi:MAG: hypothetical protein K0A90_00185 [Methanosarcinaceae archaeon]|nr:hypothetical protein [Methanosarcinaceae archaeon]